MHPVEAAVDEEFMRSLVQQLSAIGSSPLGFRVTGTPEDDEVCALLADTMRSIGLEDVRLESVHARDKQSKLHLQALLDVESLDDALERENLGAAARAVARSGRNRLARHVGRDVFELDAARHRADHPGFGWAANAHTTPSPALWDELASLRREPGSRPPGPWLARSLTRKRADSARELQRRLDRVAAAFERAASQLVHG